jgi:quercetin dioxygenase-like cupin family protein
MEGRRDMNIDAIHGSGGNPARRKAPLVLAAAAICATALFGARWNGNTPMAVRMHMTNAGAPTSSGARPTSIVKPVACSPLPHVPGKAVTTAVVTYPPDAFTPRHRHPGSVTAFIISGSVRSQLAGGPAIVYTAGQSFFEPPGSLHLFAENASKTEPASLLAIYVADENCGPLLIPDPG